MNLQFALLNIPQASTKKVRVHRVYFLFHLRLPKILKRHLEKTSNSSADTNSDTTSVLNIQQHDFRLQSQM